MYDAYIQWIEYSLLTNIQEMTSLHHGCTHIADWIVDGLTRVTLKKIVNEQSDQVFDFHQVNYLTCKNANVKCYVFKGRLIHLFTQTAN